MKREPPKSVFVTNEAEFVTACRALNGKYNVYVGINERRDGGTKAEDVIRVGTVVVDIDAKHPKTQAADGVELKKAEDAAYQILYEMVLKGFNKPSLMMSGNGYQLWFTMPPIEITSENRASVEEKMKLFQKQVIETHSGKHGVKIDNIGDLPRIIKVAGTLSIKGDGLGERPHRLAFWEEVNGHEEDVKFRDHLISLELPKKPEAIVRPVGMQMIFTPKTVSGAFGFGTRTEHGIDEEQLDIYIREDNHVTKILKGDYDKDRFPSRSEAEMSACVSMFKAGFKKEQVGYVMQKCSKIGWNEKGIPYQELTMKKALEFANNLQERAQFGAEGALWGEALGSFKPNYLQMAEKFIEIQPLHFDMSKMWWQWSAEKGCWERSDETNIMNSIDRTLKIQGTTSASVKQEILEALRRKARLNAPEKMKESWIQFKDKIYDIDTLECFEATSKFMAVNPIPWELGDSEDTPTMDKIITQWVGDKYLPSVYEIIAFCLSPNYFVHRIFCFMGSGCNGKGRCQELVKKLMGEENCCSVDLDDLLNNNFQSAKLYKKLVCFMSETNFSTMRKTSKLKALTGQDTCPMEFKNLSPFDAVNYAKILVSTNSLPISEDKTDGFYRRWMLIDFPNKFSEEKDILAEIPDAEYKNLARRSIRLLKELKTRRTFTNEGTVDERRQAYEDKSNPLKKFLREKCDVTDINASMPWWEFYEYFISFLSQNGMRMLSKPEVGRLMKEDGYDLLKSNTTNDDGDRTSVYMLLGVRMKRRDTK